MDSGNIGKPRLFTHTKSAESKATDGIHQPKRTDAEVVAQTSRAAAAQGSPSVGEVPIGRREAEKIYTPPALIRMNADAPMKIERIRADIQEVGGKEEELVALHLFGLLAGRHYVIIKLNPRGQYVTTVWLGDKQFDCLIDNGSDTMFPLEKADHLGVIKKEEGPSVRKGKVNYHKGEISTLAIDNVSLTLPLKVNLLKPWNYDFEGLVIGVDFLSHCNVLGNGHNGLLMVIGDEKGAQWKTDTATVDTEKEAAKELIRNDPEEAAQIALDVFRNGLNTEYSHEIPLGSPPTPQGPDSMQGTAERFFTQCTINGRHDKPLTAMHDLGALNHRVSERISERLGLKTEDSE